MIRHADRLTPGFFIRCASAGVTSDGLSVGNASPFKRVLGSAASQTATSLETHFALAADLARAREGVRTHH